MGIIPSFAKWLDVAGWKDWGHHYLRMRHSIVELIHVYCKHGETLLHCLRGCKLLLEQRKVRIYPLVYFGLWKG